MPIRKATEFEILINFLSYQQKGETNFFVLKT